MRHEAGQYVEQSEAHVELGRLPGHPLQRPAVPEHLLQLEGGGQRDQRPQEAEAVPEGEHGEEDVRREEQQDVQRVRPPAAQQDGERDHPDAVVVLHVARVVGMEDGLRVERQRHRVEQGVEVGVAGLRHEREEHAERAEGHDDEDVAHRDVLEPDAARVQERAGQAAEVHQRQVLHLGGGGPHCPWWGESRHTDFSKCYCTVNPEFILGVF